MSDSIRGTLDTSFALINGSLRPEDASCHLGSKHYGVVFDRAGAPTALVTQADLQGAAARGALSLLDGGTSLPPILILTADVSLSYVADSGLMTAFDAGAAGAVVLADDGRQILGVLPDHRVYAYLGSGSHQPPTSKMGWSGSGGDALLAGTIGTAVPMIVAQCADCGYRNQLDFLDRDRPPRCQNPLPPEHALALPSRRT